MVELIIGNRIRTIDVERKELLGNISKKNNKVLNIIEHHFFSQGYGYALIHFHIAVKKLKVKEGLEKEIMKYMNYLK